MRLKGTPKEWLAALRGQDQKAWKNATMMMGGITPSHKVSPEPFRQALLADEKEVVFWSITALDRLRERSRYAIPDLAPLTRHSYLAIAQAALHAMASIAPSDALVKRTILAALSHRRPGVRAEALRAAIRLRGLERRDFERIRRMLSDPNEMVRYYAEITVRNIKRRKKRQNKPA